MARQLDVYTHKDYSIGVGSLVNFDDYGILMYYAYTINQSKALQLYKATTSKYYYKLAYGLPLNGLTELDDEVFIPLNELQVVIDFINNDVLPSLQGLPQDLDLVESWNVGNIHVFLRNQGSFFENFNIDGIDINGFTPAYLIRLFERYALVFSTALSMNIIYYAELVS